MMAAEKKGTLYLIPSMLGPETAEVIPAQVRDVLSTLHEFIVEQEKAARHFLKAAAYPHSLDALVLHPLNKRTPPEDLPGYLSTAQEGGLIGLLSEAGFPAIADPGAEIVRLAHRKGIRVQPLSGPSSILLALMSSGFNGQRFSFQGYLPIKQSDRIKAIKELEQRVFKDRSTQIFMETPFRNQKLMEDMLNVCQADTYLCVACDLTLPTEFIQTLSIKEWQAQVPDLHKRPAIFMLGV